MADVTIKACDRCPLTPGQIPEVAEEHQFHIGDEQYVIDLCGGHKREFVTVMDAIQAYTEAARLVNAKPARPARKRGPRNDAHAQENRAIREWAARLNIELGDRGRIPDELRERYRAEQG